MTENNTLNGGQMIVDYLVRNNVPYAFGLCGHGNIGFIDALYERQSDIKTISTHHESVCGFMADVYYRVSGQPTATFTSCGPGSANLPISLGNAFLERLRTIPSSHVREIRGRGLWIGIELRQEAGGARRFCERLRQLGVLCKETHVHVIRFAPPLVITEQELDFAFERLSTVLQES